MIRKNCKAEEFIDRLNGRKVICFGVGARLANADKRFGIEHLEEHIAFFVDNDVNKHGLKFEYCGREFDVTGPDSLRSIETKDYVLLITCSYHNEIWMQLDCIPELKELECYIYMAVCGNLDPNVDLCMKGTQKHSYREWKQHLSSLQLKNKHRGQRCFVIGNGPSLRIEDLERLKGEITFASNRIFTLFEGTAWRPTYYICSDIKMYEMDHRKINKVEAQLRFVPLENAFAAGEVYDEITYYRRVLNYTTRREDKIIENKEFGFSDEIEEVIYAGHTVLYDALQMAVYMGFSEIYLLGVDLSYNIEKLENGTVVEHDCGRNHFSDACDEGLVNGVTVIPPIYAIRAAFEKTKEVCESKGIIIKNATRGGKLEIFERVSFDTLFE